MFILPISPEIKERIYNEALATGGTINYEYYLICALIGIAVALFSIKRRIR